MANSTTDKAKVVPAETRDADVGARAGDRMADSGRGTHDPEALDSRAAAVHLDREPCSCLASRCRGASIRRMAEIFSTCLASSAMSARARLHLTLANDWGQGAIAFATADYGTKFMIVAGLLNFIAVADAYHIAIGKKQ